MQVQKEEIRQAIIAAAIHEFKQKDYLKASMKSIATKAGVAVGNIYRYFKSKEDLFDTIVKPAYDKLIHYIHHHDHPEKFPTDELLQDFVVKEQMDAFEHIIVDHHDALLVLIDHSAGTKYVEAKQILLQQIYNHVQEELDELAKSGMSVPSPGSAHAFCVALLEGVLDLARNHQSEAEFKNNYAIFIYTLFGGFMQQLK